MALEINAIVAIAENGAIGKDGDIPWHLPEDLKYFKRTTMGYPIIMGRKCYDSIGRALPGRLNIVLTRKKNLKIEGCLVCNDIEEAYKACLEAKEDRCFIIGGADIYRLTEDQWDKYYLTEVHSEIEADTFFELMRPEQWREVSRERHESNVKNPHNYSFVVFERS